MDYTNSGSTTNLQSPNRMLSESVHHISENSLEHGVLSPASYSHYDEKQGYQYQNPSSCLNQLLQNNQYGPYSNLPLRPFASTNYHGNYRNYDTTNWNLSRSPSESVRMYYSQYHEIYPPNPNNITKVDKMKCSDYKMTSEFPVNAKHKFENRNYQLNQKDHKPKLNMPDWKFKNEMVNILDSNDSDNTIKNDEIKPDKLNSVESIELKPDSSANSNFHLNTSADLTDKTDINNPSNNNVYENKINQQSQMKQQQQQLSQSLGYDSSNYNPMMMQHPNPSYYNHPSQFRYNSSSSNVHNFINQNNTMMPSNVNRSPMMNYPNYSQTSSPGPGYGTYPGGPPVLMHQSRSFNVHSPFVPRGTSHPSFSTNPDVYMNGSMGSRHPNSSRALKEISDRKEEANINQDTSSVGSNSNKSVNARSASVSKLKSTQKNESHPPTPVSNTIPSPSQTSMSSMIDENEDSVSSLGPSESNVMNHNSIPNQTHLSQYPVTPQMSQPHSMVYPQSYPGNQGPPHSMMNSFSTHLPPQSPKSFNVNPNTIPPHRQYHQNSESQSNSNCFQKLMELGNEPDREPWIERYLRFMDENNTPLSAVPTVVKQPLDLFRLYHAVRERGGLLNVVKTKRWKEICLIVNVNASASGAYTLRRNYIKCLLDYECKFDRNGIDPGPILQEIQSLSDKKKKSTSRNAGSSPTSTISSHHNSEYSSSTSSTPRPPPHPDFNTPNLFHGHSPYNHPHPHHPHNHPQQQHPHQHHSAIHNGQIIQRGQMHHYQGQQRAHNPFPGGGGGGPYGATGPRMMGFSSPPPVNSMHPHARFETATNIPQNWNKSISPMNQQQQQHQWPHNPGSSSNSNSSCCSTHPSQRSISPGCTQNTNSISSNNISILSQQSQPPAPDSFEMSSKDVSKPDVSNFGGGGGGGGGSSGSSCVGGGGGRCNNSEKVIKKSDNLAVGSVKEADKSELGSTKIDYLPSSSSMSSSSSLSSTTTTMTTSSSFSHYSNNGSLIEFSAGQELLPCDYKNMTPPNISNNNGQYYHPPVQYPCFSYSRQYSSSYRQPGHNSVSFPPSYYPPTPNYIYSPNGALSQHNSPHHVVSNNNSNVASPHSTSTYYPIGSLQDHSRRIDWKSNYGGMPPPPPPPPNIQTTNRPNLPNIAQIGPGNHSTMLHCNYSNQTTSTNSFNHPRSSNPTLSTNLISLTRNSSLQQPPLSANLCDQPSVINLNGTKSSGSSSTSSMLTSTCHNRSHMETSRLNPMYVTPINYSKCNLNGLKRFDSLFPSDSVEATQPDYSRKRKYVSKDIKAFNPNTITMALKSGLVAEVSWALNYLNIWTKDDAYLEKLNLKNLMPMFQSLVDIWRNSLGSIFGRDMFIDDLELPVLLDQNSVNNAQIKAKIIKIETVLKRFQLKHDCGGSGSGGESIGRSKIINTKTVEDDDFYCAQDKIVNLLHGAKYSINRSGLTVKLDLNPKLEYALEGDFDLTNFIIKMCCDSSSCSVLDKTNSNGTGKRNNENYFDDDNKSSSKLKIPPTTTNLSSLLDFGGADSSFHILPPLMSQNKKINKEWVFELENVFDISVVQDDVDENFEGDTDDGEEEKSNGHPTPDHNSFSDRPRCTSPDGSPSSLTIHYRPPSPSPSSNPVQFDDNHHQVIINYKLPHGKIVDRRKTITATSVRKSRTRRKRSIDNDDNNNNNRYRVIGGGAKSESIDDSETLFFKINESDEEKMLRCICVSNAIRNLSFLNGNDRIIGSNRTTLVILGRLLLLGHEHGTDNDEWRRRHKQQQSLNIININDYWWLRWIDDIREHVFVTLVNISSYLELSKYHDAIVRPIIEGLLHWLTCPDSAAAEDALSPNHRFLGCRRLALESIMRLCVHEKNIDFILTSHTNNDHKGDRCDSVIRDLFDYLTSSFCYSDQQVVREMSLAVMHYLSMGGENGIGCLYLASARPNVINGLISFIETTESQIRQVVDTMGMEALQARPELMGTSLEFLRQSGALLNRIASHSVNRGRFSRDHEVRMLNLVISTVLDQTVAQSISGVLHLLSNHDDEQQQDRQQQQLDDHPQNQENVHSSSDTAAANIRKCKSFLTFNDLSFCEKDNNGGGNNGQLSSAVQGNEMIIS